MGSRFPTRLDGFSLPLHLSTGRRALKFPACQTAAPSSAPAPGGGCGWGGLRAERTDSGRVVLRGWLLWTVSHFAFYFVCYFKLFSHCIEFTGVTLVSEITRVSGAQFRSTSSVRWAVRSLPRSSLLLPPSVPTSSLLTPVLPQP